jgi:hypothetical protein
VQPPAHSALDEILVPNGVSATDAELFSDPEMATVIDDTNVTWLNNDMVVNTSIAKRRIF